MMNITPWPTNTSSSMVTPSQTKVCEEILQRLPIAARVLQGFAELARDTLPGSAPETWVARQLVRLVDTFELGTDFVIDGNLLVGLHTFDALFPARRVYQPDAPTVDIGVIRLAEGADAVCYKPFDVTRLLDSLRALAGSAEDQSGERPGGAPE